MEKNDFLSKIKLYFEEEPDIEKLNYTVKFIDLDFWDSIAKFKIISFVEDETGVLIEEEKMMSFFTLEELYNYIIKNIK